MPLQASMEKVSVTVQKVVTAVQGLAHVADTRENPLDKVYTYTYTRSQISYALYEYHKALTVLIDIWHIWSASASCCTRQHTSSVYYACDRYVVQRA
jgi:hypothetical protein